MFGRRSGGGAGGAAEGWMDAGWAGGGDDFTCAVCAGPAGVRGGGLVVPVVPAPCGAVGLAGPGFASAGFVVAGLATCDAFVAGWTAPLPSVGLACFAGAAVFFATVACAALAGGFAAA
jgi:hypothetical protein